MDNSKKKQYLMSAVIFAAVFAIYNIIVLLLFNDKNNIFWISYSFMCIAFVLTAAIALISFKAEDVDAVFMGIPLMSFTVFYFFAELFLSFIFMLFKSFAGTKLTVAIQIIALLAYVIFAALALLSRGAVESITSNIEQKVRTIKNLSVDVKILEEQCMDPELKKELHKIAEAIRYSDPMTNDSVENLDSMITGKVSELRYHCNNNSKNEALQACYQIASYISERNQRLILSK